MQLELHEQQSKAFLSEATEILYGGAAGGGKSHLMRVAAVSWCYAIPGLQVYIFRRISGDLIKNHMEGPSSFPVLLAEWVDKKHVKINGSDNSIEFWNGSKIFLNHCQYEKDKYKYQGAEIHVLLIDELTHFTESIYRYLRGRVRMAGIDVPDRFKGKFPRVICGSNPGGVGHHWVKAAFVDQGPMAVVRQPKSEGGMLRQFIPAKVDDNPTLLRDDPDYLDRLEGLGNPALVKAMKSGDWNIVDGGMFDDIWSDKHHVLKPFAIPKTWRVDRSFDWGSSRPFSVGWWAESDGCEVVMSDGTKRNFPRGTLFRIAEWYGSTGKPNEGLKMLAGDIAKGIKEREASMGHTVRPGPADNSIFDTQDGHCIADNMAAAGVRWERSDKNPGSRVNGWELMRQRLSESKKHPMEKPGLFVFDHCRNFLRTVPTLPRDEKKTDDIDCFIAGTLISTPNGQLPIEFIGVGDLVNTPIGPRKVIKAGISGKAPTLKVNFSNGQSLEGTLNHKIFVKNSGLLPLYLLSLDSEIGTEEELWLWQKSFTEGQLSGNTKTVDIMSAVLAMRLYLVLASCKEWFGKRKTELSQMECTSTIKITTQPITELTIWNSFLREIMQDTITKKECRLVGISKHLLRVGEVAARGNKFFRGTLRNAVTALPKENLRALIVANLLQQNTRDKYTVQKSAVRLFKTWAASAKHVLFAEKSSRLSPIAPKQSGLVVTSVDGPYGSKTVYNLTVEQAHLFYANGILATNTDAEDHIADEVRYRVSAPTRTVTTSDGW